METPNMVIQTRAPASPEERQRRNAFFISLTTAVLMAVVSVILLVVFDIMSVPLERYFNYLSDPGNFGWRAALGLV